MKKKILVCCSLLMAVCCLSACGTSNVDLTEHLIEERNNLFVAVDELYSVTLSTGLREKDYNFDGAIGEKCDFGILTFSRLNSQALANDNYVYLVTVGEQTFTGNLTKSEVDNTYSADLETCFADDAQINAKISFTGYTFDESLENVSSSFVVDKTCALKIANDELKTDIKNLDSNDYEVVMKILKDHSNSELKHYYWYIGVVAQNGETLGILIDSTSGEVIAKKV